MIEILFHEQLYSHTIEMIDNPIIVAFVWLVLTDILTGIIKGQKAKHTPDMTNSTKGWYGIAKHILTVYLVLSIYPFFISINLNYFAQLITIAWGYQYLVSILENLQAMHINVAWIRRIVDSVAKRYLAKAQDDYNPADFDKFTGKYKGRHKDDIRRTNNMVMYTVDVYSGSDDSIVRDPHAQGVIVKATQGTGYVNPKCNHQWDLAGELGKKRGLYHYAGGGNPVAEAQYFINNIKNYVGQGMLIIDWEGYQNSAWGNTNWVRQFVDEVHRLTRVWPVIYVQESALWQVANCAKDCAVWVAKYASMNWNSWTVPNMNVSSGAFGSIAGWQYTGGDMDRSIWYLDAAAWDKFAKANTTNPEPAKQPEVNPAKPSDKPNTWQDALGDTWYEEKGTFTSTTQLHLRWGARTTSATVALLPAGSVIKYDAWSRHGGYVWLRQPRGGNEYAYIACRNAQTNEPYGTFK